MSLYTVPLQLNNEPITTLDTFPVFSPITGQLLWNSSRASSEDARRACDAAATAFLAWSQMNPQRRRDILFKVIDAMQTRRQELVECEMAEVAADAAWAGMDFTLTLEMIRELAGRITSAVQGAIPSSTIPGLTALVYKKPLGVVVGFAPWNTPIILTMRAIVFALAMGNTVVLKCSEYSPKIQYLVADMFKDAGLPPGCLNTIAHGPQDGAQITKALVSHPAVAKINFTGSTVVGHKIAAVAGQHGKPILLELGGKAPLIVFKDADLESAAGAAVWGSTMRSGQVCVGTERVMIESSIYEEFVGIVKRVLDARFSHSYPFVLPSGASKVRALIQDALDKGASLAYGNPDFQAVKDSDSHEKKMSVPEPYVLTGVTKEMDIYDTESFGPVVCFYKFHSEEQAVVMANDTQYGLAAAVWTRDLAKGMRVAEGIVSGTVHINGPTLFDENTYPNGGCKNSGYGRFGATWGLDEFVTTKTVTFNYRA